MGLDVKFEDDMAGAIASVYVQYRWSEDVTMALKCLAMTLLVKWSTVLEIVREMELDQEEALPPAIEGQCTYERFDKESFLATRSMVEEMKRRAR